MEYIITYEVDRFLADFEYKSINRKISINHKHLDNGELFYYFKEFNGGYYFLDNNGNFFDTISGWYYRNNFHFEGETNKVPFNLFDDDNDELIKQKLKEGTNKMNQKTDKYKKTEIEKTTIEYIINQLKNFDLKNFKLKNGKIFHFERKNFMYYIHDNILESIKMMEKKKEKKKNYYKGDYIQENKGDILDGFLFCHGRGISTNNYFTIPPKNYPNTESKLFYNYRLGRGKIIGDKKEKFFLM